MLKIIKDKALQYFINSYCIHLTFYYQNAHPFF
jgi:hypothetical protein